MHQPLLATWRARDAYKTCAIQRRTFSEESPSRNAGLVRTAGLTATESGVGAIKGDRRGQGKFHGIFSKLLHANTNLFLPPSIMGVCVGVVNDGVRMQREGPDAHR